MSPQVDQKEAGQLLTSKERLADQLHRPNSYRERSSERPTGLAACAPMVVRLTSEGDAELAKVEGYEGLRQVGNELFAANDFASAAAHYSDALRYCGGDPTRGLAAGEEYTGGDRDVEAAHKAALVLTNRALARLKIGGAELIAAALADARAAVLLHPAHAKAHRWLSKALELTGDAEGALRALARARNLKAKAKRDEEAGAKAVAAAAEAEAAEAHSAAVSAAEATVAAEAATAAEAARRLRYLQNHSSR